MVLCAFRMQIDLLLLKKSWLILVCVDQAIEFVQFVPGWLLLDITIK